MNFPWAADKGMLQNNTWAWAQMLSLRIYRIIHSCWLIIVFAEWFLKIFGERFCPLLLHREVKGHAWIEEHLSSCQEFSVLLKNAWAEWNPAFTGAWTLLSTHVWWSTCCCPCMRIVWGEACLKEHQLQPVVSWGRAILPLLPLGNREKKGATHRIRHPRDGLDQRHVVRERSLSCVPRRAECSQAKTTASDFPD